ncbi:MAG: hypothetical protein ACK501_24230 [Planctomycetota bacterium]
MPRTHALGGRRTLACLAAAGASTLVSAQCPTTVVPLLQRAAIAGTVVCSTLWDPDGAGPLPSRLVVGGAFEAAGSVAAANVAVFDFGTSTWSTLGGGVTSTTGTAIVSALLAMPDGSLWAGGTFTHAEGRLVRHVARWDGSSWNGIGPTLAAGVSGGTEPRVNALARLANGDVVIGGRFTHAGLGTARHLARWNGTTWQPFGDLDNGAGRSIRSLLVRSSGELIAAGSFSMVGSTAANHIARWDGTTWQALAGGLPAAGTALLELQNGSLLAANEQAPGPSPSVMEWNGTTWTQFGPGNIFVAVERLAQLQDGRVLVAPTGDQLKVFTGGSWSNFGGGGAYFRRALEVLQNGDLIAGGAGPFFAGVSNPQVFDSVARWNGTAWSDLGSGTAAKGGNIECGVEVPGGFVVAGQFTSLGGIAAKHAALWNGTSWQALGAGIPNGNRIVQIARRSNGELIAIAVLNTIQSAVFRWNGAAWAQIPGLAGSPGLLAVLANDDVVVGSGSAFWRWNGATWTSIGAVVGSCRVLRALPNGELLAGGALTIGGQQFAVTRWNGATWQGVCAGLDGPVTAIEPLPNGELVVAGEFGTAYNGSTPVASRTIARWDGAQWQPFARGVWQPDYPFLAGATHLVALAGGGVLAGGNFSSADFLPIHNLARWDGAAWWPIGAGLAPATGVITALVPLANGDVIAAGPFTLADGQPAAGLVRITPGCAPEVAPIPTRCIGPAGPMSAIATTLPRLGTMFTTQASGYGPSSIGVAVFGDSASAYLVDLAAVLPTTLPGCTLMPTPFAFATMLPIGGVATFDLGVPSVPSLLGVVLREQFAQIELDALGDIASVSTSNGLQFAIRF